MKLLTEKWTKPLATKNFELNKELSSTLKSHFGCGNVYVADTESAEHDKGKLRIKVKFGSNLMFGSKSKAKARKLKD